MVRVIFVTGSLSPGGAERHAVALMKRLAERGHECHAVCVKKAGELTDRLRLRGGTVLGLDAARYLDMRAVVDFAAQLSRTRPSAVVAANAYALMYSWLALRVSRSRARLMVTFHSNR